MLIPKKIIKAMKSIILPKNFSPALTFLYYNSAENMFVGTDNFVLLQFFPKENLCNKDVYISTAELGVIDKIWNKDKEIILTMNDKSWLLAIEWTNTECIFYMKPISELPKMSYPDTTQERLFGTMPWEFKKLPITEWMEKFQEIARLIWWNWNNALITDTTRHLTVQNEYWRCELVYRRPNTD